MPAPAIIAEKVQQFTDNLADYKRDYNETQVRREFIDVLFTALGWDVENRDGYAEAYKDVVHEDKVKVAGVTKAPDYSFRIGGTRKFFVEAKKPSVQIKTDVDPAFQLRRYAWSAKLPVSILTDFEEFAVYDGRIAPSEKDAAGVARLRLYHYTEYVEKWDEIAALFSKEAVLKGAFDRFADDKKAKRGTTEVDTAFLREIEKWRTDLATNIAAKNPDLSTRQLNFAVQKTIDRVIFLRICEDRGIEEYGRLQGLLKGAKVYERLCEQFREADERYNSGLFHFGTEKGRDDAERDPLSLTLKIGDDVLKRIMESLYYPAPYAFAVFPADILGQVYEQFLGKVIVLDTKHRASVETKPEVRKAGGVFYTPTYIVDYIVAQTVGKLLAGKTPRTVEPLTVLDPACGSGSFLIGAYQALLDWHLNWYETDGAAKHAKGNAPKLYQVAGGGYLLTVAERKRILLNNIFGVDIDPQAVEVTKLSLLLKLLEGASQTNLLVGRILPDLGKNIHCGNSLIGSDFYDNRQGVLFDEEEMYRVNAFDWKKAFPKILSGDNPGFDAVIGNPPWGGNIDDELVYLHAKYPKSTQEHTDSFKIFIDKSLQLVRDSGIVSLIVPNTLLRQRRLKDVRQLMLSYHLPIIVNLGEKVFTGVDAPSCVFVITKDMPDDSFETSLYDLQDKNNEERAIFLTSKNLQTAIIKQSIFASNDGFTFSTAATLHGATTTKLGDSNDFKARDAGINYQRKNVGMNVKGRSDLATRLLYEGEKQENSDRMFWKGTDINRYWISKKTSRFCRPNFQSFVKQNEVVHLNENVFNQAPKILIRQTADTIIATLDTKGVWFGRSIIAITPVNATKYRCEYVIGILNSAYIKRIYQNISGESGRLFAQVKLSQLNQLPIRTINFDAPAEVAQHDRMVSLVEQMLTLREKLAAADATNRTALTRQADSTDAQIDRLVYELYGLTADEIALVEAAP